MTGIERSIQHHRSAERARATDRPDPAPPRRTAIVAAPDRPLSLDSGDELRHAHIAYQTWGPQNADLVILVLHALTGDALATAQRHPSEEHRRARGWWETNVGPGRPIDTDRNS